MHEHEGPMHKQTPEEFIPIGAEDQALDLVTLAKRSIRGRVPLTITTALVLGLIFAVIGYTRKGLEYQSRVRLIVQENVRSITGESIDVEGKFTDFVERKSLQFASDDVLLDAADDPELQAVGWPKAERGASKLESAISIEFKKNKSYFTATCTTEDPKTAREALVSVVEAFIKQEKARNSIAAEENELNNKIRELDGQISSIQQSIQIATREYGSTDLTGQIASLESELAGIQRELDELHINIELKKQQAEKEPQNVSVDPQELRPEDMADQDPQLMSLLNKRDELDSRIQYLIQTQGSRYPEVEDLQQERQVLMQMIDRKAEEVRARVITGSATVDPNKLSLQQLYDQQMLRQQIRSLRDERLRELRAAQEKIARDAEDLEQYKYNRSELIQRRSQLRLNQDRQQQGRIEPVSPPSAAVKAPDKRPMLAGMGFIAGAFMGVAGVVALGSFRREFRYVDDLETIRSLPPLLGTLPELEKHDPENERIAAVSVHNLRNTLQSIQGYSDKTSVVIACTSAEPGDGKTTLIQSLGASYALTGLRTILVDMDLVGGGLTARLGLSGRRGVADLLTGLEPTKCIKHTQTEKLYAMPVGDTTKCRPEQLASRPILQVIDWLRERFDVILMDTGPVLGSLEAGIVTAAADQVLLVVARGQADVVVQAAVSRLERLGVRSSGLVFNRADPEDLRRSLSAASVGAPSMHQMPRKTGEHSLDMDRSIVGSIPPPKAERVGSLDEAEDETGT